MTGTRYHGWQVQPNGVTVQQVMQDAVERLTGVRSGLTGCSRTDAGRTRQHVLLHPGYRLSPAGDKLAAALNAHLPADVAVYGCREVPADFHPRYMAAGKRYVYRIWNAPARNPFWQGYALHRQRRLDERRMDEAAAAYCGTHDFTAFCSAGSAVEDRVRHRAALRRLASGRPRDLHRGGRRIFIQYGAHHGGYPAGYGRRPDPLGRPAGHSAIPRPGPGGGHRSGLRAVSG